MAVPLDIHAFRILIKMPNLYFFNINVMQRQERNRPGPKPAVGLIVYLIPGESGFSG